MDQPYISVIFEAGGLDEAAMLRMHDDLRDWLQVYRPQIAYGEVRIAYQAQEQIDQDAQLEPERWEARN